MNAQQAPARDGVSRFELLGRAYSAIAPFMRSRLFSSPKELEPLFVSLPPDCGNVLFLITSGASMGTINPRQSFLWDAGDRKVVLFNSIEELAAAVLQDCGAKSVLTRDIRSIDARIRAGELPYSRFGDQQAERTVHIFLAEKTLTLGSETFLEVLSPYLEIFRANTAHSLNDMHSTRAAELAEFAAQMTPSATRTTTELLNWLSGQSRFGRPGWAVFEFQKDDWFSCAASSASISSLAQKVLSRPETRKLLGSGKFSLDKLESQWLLAIPFSRLHDDLSFEPDKTEPALLRARADRAVRTRKLQRGDCAAVLLYDFPPHPNILHTVVQYRQYYFDSYLPALISHAKQVIYERANQLRMLSRSSVAGADPLWDEFRRLCDDVLPLVFQALDASGGISIYRAERYSLETIFSWPADKTHRWMSLHTGRGMTATTFLKADRVDAVCNNISLALESAAEGTARFPYLVGRTDTKSEYCRKIFFKSTPIGAINFESTRVNAFSDRIITQIGSFVAALEHYIREHLAVSDSHWLSITAATYHNLHELRQFATGWVDGDYRRSVMEAIAAFDRAEDEGSANVDELQSFLVSSLERRISKAPAATQAEFHEDSRSRCRFKVSSAAVVSRGRMELFKRIGTNLLSNFKIAGKQDDFETFKVTITQRPFLGLRFSQQQCDPFPGAWLDKIGFVPLTVSNGSPTERYHHGLFLCGAIARSLGGFLWAGNSADPDLGDRSVLEILVPLVEE